MNLVKIFLLPKFKLNKFGQVFSSSLEYCKEIIPLFTIAVSFSSLILSYNQHSNKKGEYDT